MATRLGKERTERSRCQVIRFDVLPDEVLLDIFDFYMEHDTTSSYDRKAVETWQTLVHVCRRWRSLVFRSPRRLNLRLFCSPETRTKDTLDVWPALPIVVHGDMALTSGTDNIIAALEQSNRVCKVILVDLAEWQLEQVLAAMLVPFPELTYLKLSSHSSHGETAPVIPDSFLGGSAPHLLHFFLDGILFPELPSLLLSTTRLIELWLTRTPPSGYISPEEIVTPLSTLSSLAGFCLRFEYPQSLPDRETQRLPLSKLSTFPVLKYFRFEGVTKYLEDFVTLLDTPQLDFMQIMLHDETDFDIQRLAHFINRTPRLRERDEAHVEFNDSYSCVLFETLQIFVPRNIPDRRLSSVAQICNSSLHPLSTVEDLFIDRDDSRLDWTNDSIANALWLQVLLPFTTVKNLYLFKEFAPGIAAALQELVGDRITDVLPSLENIFVEEPEPFEKNIGQFIVARQLSGHRVAISDWGKARST